MPKSLADKPPKYDRCDDHPREWKAKFCYEHKTLVCSTCSDTDHNACNVKSVDDVCKTISSSYLDELDEAEKNLCDEANCVKATVESNVSDLEEQRKTLLQEIQNVNTKVNIMLENVKFKAAAEYQLQNERLNEVEKEMSEILTRAKTSMEETKELKGKHIDAKLFLKIQKHIRYMKQIEDDFNTLNRSRRCVSLTFDRSNLLNEIMSTSATFGSIRAEGIDRNNVTQPRSILWSEQSTQVTTRPIENQQTTVPLTAPSPATEVSGQSKATMQETGVIVSDDLMEPQSQPSGLWHKAKYSHFTKSAQYLGNAAGSGSEIIAAVPKLQIKVTRQNNYAIKIRADESHCFITGVALTKGNSRLLVDSSNSRVKLFSPDMKSLSCVSLHDTPRDIAVVSDQAIVTTDNKKLIILNIPGGLISDLFLINQLSIKHTFSVHSEVCGIANINDKLVVTCPYTEPPSVKMIDMSGIVHWSVSTDQQGQQLFIKPWYVCYHDVDGTSTVVVTDIEKNTLTLLLAKTGELVSTRQLAGNKEPYGATTDTAGNVYVCYYGTDEVAALTGDLTQERILLSRRDKLSGRP